MRPIVESGVRAAIAAFVMAACTGAPALEEKTSRVSSSSDAPSWLVEPLGHGTWTDAAKEADVVCAWVDARVANMRFKKRVLVEVRARYQGGAVISTLAPAVYFETLADGHERWGTDAVEIYPRGGPQGARLAGPVAYRLRLQDDVDGDGQDEMVVTPWSTLFGDGPLAIADDDPWAPGLTSPRARNEGVATSPTSVSFAPFDDAGALVVQEIDAIALAKMRDPGGRHTLHAAVFNINDPRIVSALIRAHRAGVEVRLITEATKLRPWYSWQTGDDTLLAAGVPLLAVRYRGNGSMHEKFALFDGERVATGSFNWESGSSTENHENMVLSAEPALVSAYAARFEALAGSVERAEGIGHDPSAAAFCAFGPEEQLARPTGWLIDHASRSIRVAMFTAKEFEYSEGGGRVSLFRKLVEAQKRGVAVTLMTDKGVAEGLEYFGVTTPDDATDEWLAENGVHVVLGDNAFGKYASMHHKFMVVDDEVVMTGAFNWYYDAAFLNAEDIVVFRDSALAARFTGEFVDLLRRYDSTYTPSAWPKGTLSFRVYDADTQWGDTVLLAGDLEEAGVWQPPRAVALDGSSWPYWQGSLTLPQGVRLKAKLATRHADGHVTWEAGDDRTLTTPTQSDARPVELRYR